ncbi:hypothetical protein BDZ45DRAFT_736373 [Acephala macrosclerotiorum]|nr:hypothetical protein BDZ45DRAFT_736373 [Acephala macrosclerotiorum]
MNFRFFSKIVPQDQDNRSQPLDPDLPLCYNSPDPLAIQGIRQPPPTITIALNHKRGIGIFSNRVTSPIDAVVDCLRWWPVCIHYMWVNPTFIHESGLFTFKWDARMSLVVWYIDAKKVFTMDLHRAASKGSVDFGYIDNVKFSGDVAYTPVVDKRRGPKWFTPWTISINCLIIHGHSHEQLFKVGLDTGSHYMHFLRWVLDEYFKDALNAKWNYRWKTYEFTCGMKLPGFIFTIGSYENRLT